eukprot:CAMPEP_0174250236 /NCGR_PEP_ID=MMETSP0439-20130205/477_1 /TAXON_ID=0 /ORGANISM="Stereomyxa ramosa, Strain Chinc5" /LENGTH=155 /DNA_ID=CAMNT_0015330255 /DNA_START=1 /DNA_END=468 /DNA_ORIENTATION=+
MKSEGGEGLTLQERLERMLDEWSDATVYTNEVEVLATTRDVNLNELRDLMEAFDDEETCFKFGLEFHGEHYDTHRFYPDQDLVYGRRGDAKDGAGICLLRVRKKKRRKKKGNDENSPAGPEKIYAVITYTFPTLSARAIPLLQKFSRDYLLPLLA